MLVLDSSLEDSIMLEYLRSSIFTLREIGISGKPMLIVLNKIDKIREQEVKSKIEIVENVSKDLYCPIIAVVPVSALKGMNISSLRDEIFKMALG